MAVDEGKWRKLISECKKRILFVRNAYCGARRQDQVLKTGF